MRWPLHPVERVRPSRFVPPFCPWPECPAHRRKGRGFHRYGSYVRPGDRVRVPRFVCRDCRRTCSRQTFSTTYYLKRPAADTVLADGDPPLTIGSVTAFANLGRTVVSA